MSFLDMWNQRAFLALNGSAATPHWLVATADVIANGFIYAIPVLLAAMWMWGDHRRRAVALKACIVAAIALALNQLIGLYWTHPRPFMIGLGHQWAAHAPDSSFPSDHMTVFSATGLSMLFDGELTLGFLLLGLSVCVAWARVYLGLHFPLDMAGAVSIAAFACAFVTPVWRRVGGSCTSIAERTYRRILAWPISWGWVAP